MAPRPAVDRAGAALGPPADTARVTRSASGPSTAALLCALALLAGCGGGSKHAPATTTKQPAAARRPGVCLSQARAVVASALGVAPASVAAAQSTGNNAMPQCSFRARRVTLIANVDSSPQTFQRLERAVVEEAQQFSTARNVPAPERVAGLGLDADWFPFEGQLLTADNRRLITVTVKWPGAAKKRARALSAAVARIYLKQSAH